MSLPGKSKADSAKMMVIPAFMLKIIHNRHKIVELAKACESLTSKKIRVLDSKFLGMEKILFQFFNQCPASSISVEGPLQTEKVKEIAMKLAYRQTVALQLDACRNSK